MATFDGGAVVRGGTGAGSIGRRSTRSVATVVAGILVAFCALVFVFCEDGAVLDGE